MDYVFSLCNLCAYLVYWFLLTSGIHLARADSEETNSRELAAVDLHVSVVPVCGRLPIPGYKTYFLEITGYLFNTIKCPPGFYFDTLQCDCVFEQQVPPPIQVTDSPALVPVSTVVMVTDAPTKQPGILTAMPSVTTRNPIVKILFDMATPGPRHTEVPLVFRRQPVVLGPPVIVDSGLLSKKSIEIICSGCRFEGGIGFKRHDRDCDKYVMCYVTGTQGDLRADVRSCSIGSYWDQALLTCRNSTDVSCPTEKCVGKDDSYTYSFAGDCRAYWRCRRGVSVGHCCPKGQGFFTGSGCIINPTCDSNCGIQEIKDVSCDKVSYPGNPRRFRQAVEGHGLVDMSCADGTVFDPETCICVTDMSVTPQTGCKDELDLTFNGTVLDVSGRKVHVADVNVTYSDQTACFHGDGAIVVPRFANADIGKNLDIHLRFRSSGSLGTDLQAIVYNGDCGMEPSIVIAVNKDKIIFALGNKNNSTTTETIYLPVTVGNWITGRFSLHDEFMSMTVNGHTEQMLFFGEIDRSRCGLKIGWGKDFQSFTGCISQLSISFCPKYAR